MGFILSLALITGGAVLRWAVTTSADGIDLAMVGLILIIIGVVGFILATISWLGWWNFSGRRTVTTTASPRTVVTHERVVDEPLEPRP